MTTVLQTVYGCLRLETLETRWRRFGEYIAYRHSL
jgi:hypothetical protein